MNAQELVLVQEERKKESPTKNTFSCDECGKPLHPMPSGYTCIGCGLVHGQYLVDSSYNDLNGKNYGHKGAQSTSRESKMGDVTGIGSFMGGFKRSPDKDFKGKIFDLEKKRHFERLKKRQFNSKNKFNGNMARVLNVLKKITNYLDMNDAVRHRAAYLYKTLVRNIPDGLPSVPRNNITLLCVCLSWATREYPAQSYYTYKRIASIFQLHGHRVKVNGIQSVIALLKKFAGVNYVPRTWHQFIVPIIQNLGNDPGFIKNVDKEQVSVHECTRQLLNLALVLKEGLPVHPDNPLILACACVYGAGIMYARLNGTGLLVTTEMIAKTFKFDVSATRILERYDMTIKNYLDALVS